MIAAASWIVSGLVLAGLEMHMPGIFMLWIGLGAIGTGLATWALHLGWEAQFATFVVLSALLVLLIGWRLRRRRAIDTLNAPTANLIGQTCRAVAFDGAQGRVALADGTWLARLHAGSPSPQPGQHLRVTGLDGTTLLVTPEGSQP